MRGKVTLYGQCLVASYNSPKMCGQFPVPNRIHKLYLSRASCTRIILLQRCNLLFYFMASYSKIHISIKFCQTISQKGKNCFGFGPWSIQLSIVRRCAGSMINVQFEFWSHHPIKSLETTWRCFCNHNYLYEGHRDVLCYFSELVCSVSVWVCRVASLEFFPIKIPWCPIVPWHLPNM